MGTHTYARLNGKVGSHALTRGDLAGYSNEAMREYRKTASVHAIQLNEHLEVDTEEGKMRCGPGDYLCEGPHGELWPVKQAIFESTYEEA